MNNKIRFYLVRTSVLLLLFNILELVLATDYCNKYLCSDNIKHLACENNGRFAKSCANTRAEVVKLDRDIRHSIVQQHNKIRNQVAGGTFHKFPIASKMGRMVWDQELEYLAKLSIKQCTTNQNNCIATRLFPRPGQNLIYYKHHRESNIKEVIKTQINEWMLQYEYIDPKTFSPYPGSSSAFYHDFLQIIMDHANYIGCAVLLQTRQSWKYQHLTCLYSVGVDSYKCKDIYKRGNISAEFCKTGRSRHFNNLCSKNEIYDYRKEPRLISTTYRPKRTTAAAKVSNSLDRSSLSADVGIITDYDDVASHSAETKSTPKAITKGFEKSAYTTESLGTGLKELVANWLGSYNDSKDIHLVFEEHQNVKNLTDKMNVTLIPKV